LKLFAIYKTYIMYISDYTSNSQLVAWHSGRTSIFGRRTLCGQTVLYRSAS